MKNLKPKLGELFAGIGGFGMGFEQAGWETSWQVEWNEWNRAVLRHNFPKAKNYGDITKIKASDLAKVDCIAGGFPCTNISVAGNMRRGGQPGLHGEASGLFFTAMEIIAELQPRWVVLENVPNLLHSNEGRDFAEVLFHLRECGYDATWRVLNSAGFGVPQSRRRLFVVGHLGAGPIDEFIFDSAPVESIPCTIEATRESRPESEQLSNTLLAANANCRISLGSEILIGHRGGRNQMVERQRISEATGVPLGVDDYTAACRFSSGNAVSPPVARWIAEVILRSF